jgi:hypothetical protein
VDGGLASLVEALSLLLSGLVEPREEEACSFPAPDGLAAFAKDPMMHLYFTFCMSGDNVVLGDSR